MTEPTYSKEPLKHVPVLLEETIKMLDINPSGTYIDGTAGGGGHALRILDKLETGRLILIDRDPDAIRRLHKKFQGIKNISIIDGNFCDIQELTQKTGVFAADGILLDIGVSSFQFDDPTRGFSYNHDSKLDMRMSKTGISAYDLVNNYSEKDISYILRKNSEEKFSKRISSAICAARQTKPIESTFELSDVVKSAIPAPARREKGHPAKRTFQAIRIAINNELENLEKGLDSAFSLLKLGGKLAVITFHSLEDRIVKKKMLSWTQGCICPPDFPICTCGNKPKAELANKKPIIPSQSEISQNPRSKSAKLRGITKIL